MSLENKNAVWLESWKVLKYTLGTRAYCTSVIWSTGWAEILSITLGPQHNSPWLMQSHWTLAPVTVDGTHDSGNAAWGCLGWQKFVSNLWESQYCKSQYCKFRQPSDIKNAGKQTTTPPTHFRAGGSAFSSEVSWACRSSFSCCWSNAIPDSFSNSIKAE